jgi:hypothetical protein
MRSSELAELRRTLVIPEPLIPPPPPIPGGGPPSSTGWRPTLPSVSPLPFPVTDSHAPISVCVDSEPIELPVERLRWPKLLAVALALGTSTLVASTLGASTLGALAPAAQRLWTPTASQTAVASLAPRAELMVARAMASATPRVATDTHEPPAEPAAPERDDATPARREATQPAPNATAPVAQDDDAALDDDPTDGDLVNPYQAPAPTTGS